MSETDIRSMLIALVGHDFGEEPEKRIAEIRESRKSWTSDIAEQARITPSHVVVDLGSGCGFGTYWLAKRARLVHACDISPSYLSFAQRECSDLSNIAFHQIESRDLSPLGADSVDIVCSMSVFIHLNLYDIYWYFKEFQRIVKPGGRVWLDFADSESLDLTAANRDGGLFLAHAKQYAAAPCQVSGYMCWNSAGAIIGIANHFGFAQARKNASELLFEKLG